MPEARKSGFGRFPNDGRVPASRVGRGMRNLFAELKRSARAKKPAALLLAATFFGMASAGAQSQASPQAPASPGAFAEEVLVPGTLIHGGAAIGPPNAARSPAGREPPTTRDPIPKAPAPGANVASPQSPGKTFRDCANCPEMVPIPPGSFTMGVLLDEEDRVNLPADRRGWSEPQREVRIAYSFAVGKYEVTRDEFLRFVSETNRPDPIGCFVLQSILRGDQNRRAGLYIGFRGLGWRRSGFPQTDRHPVVCVNWIDAQAYAAWLSTKTGKPYRLLTEAEWEYAARAGTTGPWFWGDNLDAACGYANVPDLTLLAVLPGARVAKCRDGYWHTAPVGIYQPNAFGLHDVLGNVWEWTEDCWNRNYDGAPADGSAWTIGECGRRVVRGGAYNSGATFPPRLGYRFGDVAGVRVFDGGFRVARNLP